MPKRPGKNESDALRLEYERMMYVIKALGGGIWEFHVMSGFLHCNRRWHEVLGLNYDTQRVLSVEQFKAYIHPDDVERATAIDLEELRRLITRDERYAIEFRVIHRDGKPRWIRSVASLVDGPGNELRAIGCITDITPLISPSQRHPDDGLPHNLENSDAKNAASRAPNTEPCVFLTEREKECLRWVSFGKTASETATILGRSPRTIEFHLNKAIRKLNAVNKVQAAFLAIQQNLL